MIKIDSRKTATVLAVFLTLTAAVELWTGLGQKIVQNLAGSCDQGCSVLYCGVSNVSMVKSAEADVQSEVEEALICQCGCGIVLKHCPHQNCGFAIPAREYIVELIKQGMTKDQIIDVFVKRYGQKALATPKKEGFNLLGYVLPFLALAAAAFFLSRVIKGWTSRGMKDEEKVLEQIPADTGSELDKKIEDELKKLD